MVIVTVLLVDRIRAAGVSACDRDAVLHVHSIGVAGVSACDSAAMLTAAAQRLRTVPGGLSAAATAVQLARAASF